MKIKVERTETTDLEISAPRFWVREESWTKEYLGWIDEKTVYNILNDNNGNTKFISLNEEKSKVGEISTAFSRYKEISEEEFLAAHEAALNSLSLKPQLIEDKIWMHE